MKEFLSALHLHGTLECVHQGTVFQFGVDVPLVFMLFLWTYKSLIYIVTLAHILSSCFNNAMIILFEKMIRDLPWIFFEQKGKKKITTGGGYAGTIIQE